MEPSLTSAAISSRNEDNLPNVVVVVGVVVVVAVVFVFVAADVATTALLLLDGVCPSRNDVRLTKSCCCCRVMVLYRMLRVLVLVLVNVVGLERVLNTVRRPERCLWFGSSDFVSYS